MFASGTNKPMDTTNAKTHHDFVNPIYPASTKVNMMLYLCTLCLFCSIRIVSCNARKVSNIHRQETTTRVICGNRL